MNTPWSMWISPPRPSDASSSGVAYSAPGDSIDSSYDHPITAIVDSLGTAVCHDATYYSRAPSIQQMRIIVQCVNAHADLVEALDKAHKALLDAGFPENTPLISGIRTTLSKAI